MSANKLLFQFAKQYPKWIILSTLFGFSGAAFNGVGTTLIVPAVFELLNTSPLESSLDLPPLLHNLLEPFLQLPDEVRGIAMLSAIVIAISLKNLANYFSILTGAALSRALTKDLREAGIKLLLEVDLDYHNRMRTGDIIQRLNDQVSRTVTSISTSVSFIRIAINILFFIFVLVAISWQLTAISVMLLLGVVLLNRYIINRAKEYGHLLAETSKQYSIRVLETLNGMRLVRSTANEEREYHLIDSLIKAREEAAFKSQMNSAVVGPFNEMLSILALIALIIISQIIFRDNITASATVLLTFLFVLSRLIPFISQMNSARGRLANSAASVDAVYDFLRRDNKSFMVPGTRPYQGLQKGIHFHQISFQYPGTDHWVLKEVELYLPKGKTLALVGTSGAGKSTLADLLPRFYDPNQGRITIDELDLRELDIKSLRRRMGIVSQDTFLFNTSVRENIAYAHPEATDEEIVQAAHRANAYEFITRLPQGFETLIGDRGVLLSGGQRQRIAIARALLQNPDILVLDEATSALDTVSERLVQAALDELSKDRTILVIAHRLSTIQKADQIAVLEHGQVLEVGTHAELLQRGGKYADLYSVQFAGQLPQHPPAGELEAFSGNQTSLSYDLRTDLSILMGVLQLVREKLVENESEQEDFTQEAYRAAINLLHMVEHLEASNFPSLADKKEVYPISPFRDRSLPPAPEQLI